MAESAGTISDARNIDGVLTCQILDTCVPYKPLHKSCIAVLNSIDYAWLADASTEPEITDNGARVAFPDIGQSITLSDILEQSTIWFLRWSSSGFVDLPEPMQLAGCWRTGNGFILLHSSGMARFITVSKSPASDDGGDWRWKQTSKDQFIIEKLDAPAADMAAYRQVYRLNRYDGVILEVRYRSGFNLKPDGFPDVRYLKREPKYPKLWAEWA